MVWNFPLPGLLQQFHDYPTDAVHKTKWAYVGQKPVGLNFTYNKWSGTICKPSLAQNWNFRLKWDIFQTLIFSWCSSSKGTLSLFIWRIVHSGTQNTSTSCNISLFWARFWFADHIHVPWKHLVTLLFQIQDDIFQDIFPVSLLNCITRLKTLTTSRNFPALGIGRGTMPPASSGSATALGSSIVLSRLSHLDFRFRRTDHLFCH